jgi:hypothetical protein
MIQRFSEERGVAVVTALLVSMITVSVGATVVALSMHNTNASSYDRKRIQAIDAAEAGLSVTLSTIGVSPTDTLPCEVDATLSTAPQAEYHVAVDYYATYPPAGDPLDCTLFDLSTPPPAGAHLVSTGTAVAAGSPVAVSRTMETVIRVAPIYKPFGQAIFANDQLNMVNNLDVVGNSGNDGDVYTNGNWLCNNSSHIRGSVITQGNVNISNSCTVEADLHARASVNMSQSATVNHDVISATSSISMSNNTKVFNNATSATTCTGCTTGAGGRVGGDVTTNHLSPPPPVRPFPVVNYVEADWVNAGYQPSTFSDCNSARAFINDTGTPPASRVVRISPECDLVWAQNSTINVRGDLAIITDGSIATANNTKFQAVGGGPYNLFMIVPYNSALDCSDGDHDIYINNNTLFQNVKILLYSRCTVTLANNNSGQGGQIFGGNVDITNLYNLHFFPILIPGAGDVSGYTMDIAFMREIKNP